MKEFNKVEKFLLVKLFFICIIAIIITSIAIITYHSNRDEIPETNSIVIENSISEDITTNDNIAIEEDETTKDEISTEIMYTTTGVNMRTAPDINSEIIKVLYINTEVNKICEEGDWTKILYENEIYYIKSQYLSKTKVELPKKIEITSRGGTIENRNNSTTKKLLGTYKITYYCACSKCCGKSTGITASGAKATPGVTIAAPSSFSFGTKLSINGNVYTVQDRGGAINGNRLDIFVGSHQEALNKGVTYAEVYLVE